MVSSTSDPEGLLLPLSLNDRLVAIAVCAAAVYFYFKKFEPAKFNFVAPLLVLPPQLLTPLLFSHLSTWHSALASHAIWYGVLVSCVIGYRLSPFHPLAKYPGPLHLRLSKVFIAWTNYHGYQYRYVYELHQRYGDAVRVGPNEISLRDLAAVQPLMGTTGLPKGPIGSGRTFHPEFPSLILLSSDPHVERRKPWTRAFNSSALKGYEEIISRRARQLVDALAAKRNVDLGEWFSYFTFDFMSDMAFGGGSEMLRDGDADSIWAQMGSGMKAATIFGHLPWLAWWVRETPSVGAAWKRMRAFSFARTQDRVQRGSLSKDLFYYLNNEDGKLEVPRPMAHVISDGNLAVIAGSDTTSGVLTHLFYHLLASPEWYARLRDEVDAFYPPGENALDTKHHTDMPVLSAVLNEALRLHPAVPCGSQRTTKGVGARSIGPYFVPDNTQVSLNTYSLHRDARYFSSPDEFWPARWLSPFEHEGWAHEPAAFIPFSFGPANCVGKNLALQEMRMVVCLMVQQLSVRAIDGWEPRSYEDGLKETLVQEKGVLPVVVERRGKA